MRDLFEPDSGKIDERHDASAGHRPAGAMLAVLLATAANFATPTAAHATMRYPHRHSISREAIHQAPNSATHRETGTAPPAVAEAQRGEKALLFAIAQLGKPYRYGASGPNAYDCSGLAQAAWRAAGVAIPRTTGAQARFGAPVPLGRIQPGDLVVFYADASHVGIYAGHGTVIVAPHRGKVVSYAAMRWMPIHTIRRPG